MPPKKPRAEQRQPNAPVSSKPGDGSRRQQGSTAELEEKIRRRAYELWEQKGRPSGSSEEDWREAEAEILGITGGG
jgi:hypothetical protein